jgi:heptose I phosphotransferase
LPAAVPVAAGRRGSFWRVETFCLSAGLGETEKLEDHAPKRFSPPLDGKRIREKHSLAEKIGRLARKMHDSGFNHRDFYLCHVHRFVNGGELAILDLNRAGFFPGGVSERWVVKDLAALDAGPMPDGILHETDRLRCFKSYRGCKGKMTPADRELLKKVNQRAATLKIRGEKSRRRDAEYISRKAAGGG